MHYLLYFLLIMPLHNNPFKAAQLQNTRVKNAYQEKEEIVKGYFRAKKISYDGFTLFIRAFKREQKLEVWVKVKTASTFTLLHTYDFCSTSGTIGPKRKEGDLQIPEGIYHINHFNPISSFHLSLGINYPNNSDKILGNKYAPGSAIYIHGNCVTVGCIPITDDKIKELYILAVEAKNNGQEKIPVHIFPSKLDEEFFIQEQNNQHAPFWKSLQPIYQSFENDNVLRTVSIDNKGTYSLR